MARIRTIKPDFWVSEKVCAVSIPARLLFIGMWNFCDDQGVHQDSAPQLKAEIFPMENFSARDMRAMIDELLTMKMLRRFEHNGDPYLYVVGWEKHQVIDRKSKYKHPAPPALSEDSANTLRVISEDSASSQRGLDAEGKGREGKGSNSLTSFAESEIQQLPPFPKDQEKPSELPTEVEEKKPKRKSQLPDDFFLTDAMREYAVERLGDVCDTDRLFENFVAHHRAKGSVMADWVAAWRTWVGNGEKMGFPRKSALKVHQESVPFMRQRAFDRIAEAQKVVTAQSLPDTVALFHVGNTDTAGHSQKTLDGPINATAVEDGSTTGINLTEGEVF